MPVHQPKERITKHGNIQRSNCRVIKRINKHTNLTDYHTQSVGKCSRQQVLRARCTLTSIFNALAMKVAVGLTYCKEGEMSF